MHRFGRVIRGQTRLNMKKPQQSAPVRAEMVSENPGNSGKAKTQERKNKKRPAVCSAGGKKEAEEGRNLPQSSNRFDVQFQSYRGKTPDA